MRCRRERSFAIRVYSKVSQELVQSKQSRRLTLMIATEALSQKRGSKKGDEGSERGK